MCTHHILRIPGYFPGWQQAQKDCSLDLLVVGKQEMSFPRCCFPAQPGCASPPVPQAGFWSLLCLLCMGERTGNRKNNVEISGVGLIQQTTHINPFKSQAVSWLVFFFKCLNFRVLTAVKRQEKKTFCGLSTFSCWWFLLSSFGQGCTHGLVFSL